MKKSELSFFITLSLAMLVPVPGRLAYGIILILFLNILVLTGILFKKLISFFYSGELQNVILCAILQHTDEQPAIPHIDLEYIFLSISV